MAEVIVPVKFTPYMLKSKIKKGKSVAAKSIVKEKQVCANFP